MHSLAAHVSIEKNIKTYFVLNVFAVAEFVVTDAVRARFTLSRTLSVTQLLCHVQCP